MTGTHAETAVEAVRAMLEPAGAPARIAVATVSALGQDAADQLGHDPWRVLSVPGVLPAAADALARSVDPRTRWDDVRRGAALVTWLLTRAADDGHTAVRESVVTSALRGYDVDDGSAAISAAIEGGGVVGLESSTVGLARWAGVEGDVASAVSRLMSAATPLADATMLGEVCANLDDLQRQAVAATASSGVSAIMGSPGPRVDEAIAAVGRLAGERTVVVPDASTLGLEDAARSVSTSPDGTHLLFVGDPDELPAPGPGRFFADLVSSGAVPVTELRDDDNDIARLAHAVREGRLPVVDSPHRHVVVVPARDASEAVRRTLQLVSDSIPRALGIPTGEIQVLSPRLGGLAGVHALNRALVDVAAKDDAAMAIHHAAGSRWPAVVLVLPGEAAGALSRSLLYTAVTRAQRHLSVIHAAGPALAVAIARPPRARRTRLGPLLADGGLAQVGLSSPSASDGSTSTR